MRELITKCYGMGLEGRGVTMLVQHKAERGANVEGWDLALVIDCTNQGAARASTEADWASTGRRPPGEPP